MKFLVHNSTHHNTSEYREIKKLAEQFHEKMQQQPLQDGAPSRQREGKQKMNPQEEKDIEMEFQDAKRALKAVYDHSESKSSGNEHRKALHVMFEGSWTLRPDASSRPCTEKLRWWHLHQKQCHIASGWRRRLVSTPLTASRAWRA
jgi:hypothetical protein